jgi:chlorite dismutase
MTEQPAAPKRQFINFAFYKLDPAFRRLPDAERRAAKDEFLKAYRSFDEKLICVSYSHFGIRAESDLMLWRISYAMEDFETMSSVLLKTKLGAWLHTPYSYLSMSKRSTYVDKINPEHEGQRSIIKPGRYKYLFVYPFLKTREWFLKPQEERQKMMDEHIRVGNKFPSVKLNTTYSFGFDDQEWVVAFETDVPGDFLDLVMALRETQGSLFTLRDTPIFTCLRRPMDEILDVIA